MDADKASPAAQEGTGKEKDPPTPVNAKESKDGAPVNATPATANINADVPPMPVFKPLFYGSPMGSLGGKMTFDLGSMLRSLTPQKPTK